MIIMSKQQAIRYYVIMFQNTNHDFYADEIDRILELDLNDIWVCLG